MRGTLCAIALVGTHFCCLRDDPPALPKTCDGEGRRRELGLASNQEIPAAGNSRRRLLQVCVSLLLPLLPPSCLYRSLYLSWHCRHGYTDPAGPDSPFGVELLLPYTRIISPTSKPRPTCYYSRRPYKKEENFETTFRLERNKRI